MAIQTDPGLAELSSKPLRRLPIHGFSGIFIIAVAEIGLFLGESFSSVYFTPIVWTGYILLVDGLLWVIEGDSFLRSRRREFFWMLPWSVVCWLVFEGFNLYLQNWTYVGLPEQQVPRLIGYVWSFATIFPAVLLTAEIIERRMGPFRIPFRVRPGPRLLYLCVAIGTVMLVVPLVVPQEIASKLFVIVWVGFIFVLDPINFLKGRRSLLGQLGQGNAGLLVSLMAAGLWCGFLWEFWNYWAGAKWLYDVPLAIVGPKIFEMPILGYLGFLPFAVECFVMNEFFYVLFPTLQRRGEA